MKVIDIIYMCFFILVAFFCLEGEVDFELFELLDDFELLRLFYIVNIYIFNIIKNFIVILYRKNGGINCLIVIDRSYMYI